MLPGTKEHIKVLLVEDNPGDAVLIRSMLLETEDIHPDVRHSNSLSSAFESLAERTFDIIVLDLGLPDSLGLETFLSVHTKYPEVPVIVLTGMSDEELAVKTVQAGAQDYLVKGEVERELLVRSVRYSIGRQRLIAQLEKSLNEIRTLKGLVPICAWCRNIRDDKGYWKKVETYIEEHTEASFTHGICPECLKKLDPGLHEKALQDNSLLLREKMDASLAAPSAEGYGHIKVLLIEDNTSDADYIRRILSKESHMEVEYSDRLSSGIEYLSGKKFDVVLCDLGLPDSQGIEALIRIHALYPDLPVIVLTGLHDEELAAKAVRSGAQDYLVKGQLDLNSLLKSIHYSIERQKLITALDNNLREIRKLERERKNILSMFAHDIKNAIVPSVGFLMRILSGKTKDLRRDLELIRDELSTAEDLLANFIEFSRFDTKECKPVIGQFDLEAAVLKQIENTKIKAGQKNIKIAYEFSERPFPPIKADGTMINRVITNLLDNAIKYTNPEGTISVKVLNTDKHILVQVSDTGIGIPNDQVQYVFDIFYRASSEGKGSGLGLSIARTIIEAHKGEIWAESIQGKGSTFSFTLPK